MFAEYTRAILVLDETRKVLKGVGRCASFLAARFLAAWGVFLAASLVTMVLTLLYFLISRLAPASSLFSFWLIFLLGQVYLFLRLAGKVFLLGSCYHFSRLERGGATPGNYTPV